MKIIQTLKLLWRSILAIHESKITFYHGNQKLINENKYDCLFRYCSKQDVELLFFDSEKELLYLKKDGITVVVNEYYSIYIEVLINKVYTLPPQVNSNFCVFDIGMNKGYASLFFANHPNCTKVFGFELDKNIYEKALQNFAFNETLSAKITSYNFGLWNVDDELDIFYGEKDWRTGITSCVNEQPCLTKLVQDQKHKDIHKATVKKSSDVFATILSEINVNEKKIMKIDIEGAEYAVFEDLYKHGILQQFDVIIGECHNGIAELEKYLGDFICVNKNSAFGLITFCFINKNLI